ncbi:MAG TPA: hypothetical protein VEQ42_00820 [Pyrinomonadaceae bacterium]|nr:hypothetical protein [Pyrinomonadaceae bacterium]
MNNSRTTRAASLAAFLLLTAFALNAPAQTTAPNRAPSPNGKIVYTSNEQNRESGDDQIWVMNADGRNKTRLTFTQSFDGSPVFSPDGQHIAFNRDGTDLYVMNADGSGQTFVSTVAPQTVGVNNISWSPNGKRVKYENFDGAWVKEVFDANGNISAAPAVNVSAGAQNLRWSPDGTKLLYFWTGGPEGNVNLPRGIYTVNADGSGRTMLAPISINVDNPQPAWSSGWQVAYKDIGAGGFFDIFVLAPNGSPVNVTNTPGLDELAPAWSPDGSKIALFTDDGTASGVSVVSLAAPGVMAHLADLVSVASGFGFNDTLVWSPDGTQIIYQDEVASNKTGTLANSTEIYVVDADGGRESNYTKTRKFTEKVGNWQKVTP